MSITAEIVYKTHDCCKSKPVDFTTGGYTVQMRNGEKIHFDWCDMVGKVTRIIDGFAEIKAKLSYFDDELANSNKDDEFRSANFNVEKLINEGKLIESYYEAYTKKSEIKLDLINFKIFTANKEYVFPEKTINEFNRRYNK